MDAVLADVELTVGPSRPSSRIVSVRNPELKPRQNLAEAGTRDFFNQFEDTRIPPEAKMPHNKNASIQPDHSHAILTDVSDIVRPRKRYFIS